MSDTLELKGCLSPRHLVAGAQAFALAAVLALGASAALAQQPAGPLETRMEHRKVVLADGRERFEGADSVKPGDVIEYVATYRNTGKDAITGLVATLPVPAQTEYLPGSARPAGATASVDGVKFEAIPLKRKARAADGKEVEQLVPYREYRALRWNAGELGAQKSVAYTARVKVADDAPAIPRAVAK